MQGGGLPKKAYSFYCPMPVLVRTNSFDDPIIFFAFEHRLVYDFFDFLEFYSLIFCVYSRIYSLIFCVYSLIFCVYSRIYSLIFGVYSLILGIYSLFLVAPSWFW